MEVSSDQNIFLAGIPPTLQYKDIAAMQDFNAANFDCNAESPLASLLNKILVASPSTQEPSFTFHEHVDSHASEDVGDSSPIGISSPSLSHLDLNPPSTPRHLRASPILLAFRSPADRVMAIHGISASSDDGDESIPFSPTVSLLLSPMLAPSSPSSSLNSDSSFTLSNTFSFVKKRLWPRSPGRNNSVDLGCNKNTNEESPRRSLFHRASCGELEAADFASDSSTVHLASAQGFVRQRVDSSNSASSVSLSSPSSFIHVLRTARRGDCENIPDHLSWLNNTTVDLWIDQEGHRAVRASFRLAGYSAHNRCFEPFRSESLPTSDLTGVQGGVADFVPCRRQTFNFHQSNMESPPVLRRMTTNGDERKDHISRQATMMLKNGVYTVRGCETWNSAQTDDASLTWESGHDTKLKWKFDYMAQDRVTNSTDKIIPGEKVFTPLAFSCSPFLLRPPQGKKTGLMHVFKKSMSTKIIPEILKPPKPPISRPCPSGYFPVNGEPELFGKPVEKPKWNLHRRALSHTVDEGMHLSASAIGFPSLANVKIAKRRRASSVGDHMSVKASWSFEFLKSDHDVNLPKHQQTKKIKHINMASCCRSCP